VLRWTTCGRLRGVTRASEDEPTFRFETRNQTTKFRGTRTRSSPNLLHRQWISKPWVTHQLRLTSHMQSIESKSTNDRQVGVVDAIKRVASPRHRDIDGVQINVLRLTKIANTNSADPLTGECFPQNRTF
jgi:hypothetical protein